MARSTRSLFLALLLLAIPLVLVASTERDPEITPAHSYYKNINLFTKDWFTAADLDKIMADISSDLGVQCSHCHDLAALERDDLEPSQVAARRRIPQMWSLVATVNSEHFPGQGGPVRCWTCHRGSKLPEVKPPPEVEAVDVEGTLPFELTQIAQASRPRNLRVLGVTDEHLLERMRDMSTALGFACLDCHVDGDYASDAKEIKLVARRMLSMVTQLNVGHFEGRQARSCWSCHRGHKRPHTERPVPGAATGHL